MTSLLLQRNIKQCLSKCHFQLFHIGASHGVLVVLLVNKDILFVRIDVTFLGDADDVGDGDDVGHKSESTDDGHHCGVGSHGVNCGADSCCFTTSDVVELLDGLDTIGILHGQHGPAEPLAAVLEGLLEERIARAARPS